VFCVEISRTTEDSEATTDNHTVVVFPTVRVTQMRGSGETVTGTRVVVVFITVEGTSSCQKITTITFTMPEFENGYVVMMTGRHQKPVDRQMRSSHTDFVLIAVNFFAL